MNSSGMKRGLATVAVSALAVTGLPFLASSASAKPNVDQYTANQVELLSQFSGAASVKNDGQNTTVRLEAAAGSNVSGVTFQYNTNNPNAWVDIATVSTRNDDGAFAYEWNASALAGATLDLRAVSINNTTTDPDAHDQRTGVALDGGGAATESVNLNDGSSLGVFQAPYDAAGPDGDPLTLGDNEPAGDYAVLEGTTSATGGSVDLFHFFGNPNAGVAAGSAAVSHPSGSSTGTFKGIADIDGYDFTGSPDELSFGAQRDSDDVESYTLYSQTITDVTASPTSKTIPAGQSNTPITITVKDQNGKAIANAEVRRSGDEALIGYTDADGKVTTNQAPGTRYYYANATGSDPYEAGLGDKRSADVVVDQYVPAATSLAATSRDGAAFDIDENDTTGTLGAGYVAGDDITVQVKDQNGNDKNADGQTLSYYWVATPFDGSAVKRYPTLATDKFTATETGTGVYKVAFPKDGVPGSYELFASLSEVPVTGGNNVAESKILTVKAGQSKITYDEASPETGPAGGQEVVEGMLALEDGTGLSGRKIDLTLQYDGAAYAHDDATPDAVFLKDDGTSAGTSRSVVTGNDGAFSVTVKDQAENPQLAEIGDNIDAVTANHTTDGDNPNASKNDHGVNFLVSTTPASIKLSAQDNHLESPGEVETFTATVMSGDQNPTVDGVQAVPLTGEAVSLTTDHGYFTDGKQEVTAGGDQGVFDNDGQSKTVKTDENGVATFHISMGRDEGFDDDGKVTSTIKATAGAVSDTTKQDWTSETPLNGGAVEVVFSPTKMQQSGVLPKAPITDEVWFDVFLTDQFGNRVGGENFTVSDNTGLAGISNKDAVSDYAEDGDFKATATAEVDQKVTVTWDAPSNKFDNATPPAPAAPGTETLTGDRTVNWYEVDFAASTFSLTHSGADVQPVGTTVTETYMAKDQHGEPIADLHVSFFRAGPDDLQDGDGNFNGMTGQDGSISYIFQGAKPGKATITATGRKGGATGDVVPQAQVSDVVEFQGAIDKVSPELELDGQHNGRRDDVLKADAKDVAAGATVVLKRKIRDGLWERVARKVLNGKGNARFRVEDLNGKKRTVYRAIVKPTDTTTKDRSSKRIR